MAEKIPTSKTIINKTLLCSFEYSQDKAILHYPINTIYKEHILMTIIQSSLLKNVSNLYYTF